MGTYCEIAREKMDSKIDKKTRGYILTTKKSSAKKFFSFERTSQSTKKYSILNEFQVNAYNTEFKEPVCFPNPCSNRGSCIIVGNRFECKCLNSYSGKYCEISKFVTTKSSKYSFFKKKYFTAISSNPNYLKDIINYSKDSTTPFYNRLWQCPSSCHNNLGHGFCTLDASSNPKCLCNGDWTGHDCNQKNYCLYNRCINNSTCVNYPASQSYVCLCPLTHSGNYCEIKLKIQDLKFMLKNNINEFDEINKENSETKVKNNENENHEPKMIDKHVSNIEDTRMMPVERLIKSSSEKCKNNGIFLKSSSECKCKQGYWGQKCELKNKASKYNCIDEDCIDANISTSTTTKNAKQALNLKKLTKMSKKNTKISKSTTTFGLISTLTNNIQNNSNQVKIRAVNPCMQDDALCLKYPNGNESFICVPNTLLDYYQCVPSRIFNCFENNPCLNGGLCIQNNDLSLNVRQQAEKNSQSINFSCICKDNFTGQLCESEICSPVRALLPNHVMCSSVSPNLILEDLSISNSEINFIVTSHNNVRRQVSPSSSNMQKLYWDKRLEILAQKRAQMCSIETGGILTRQDPGYGIVIGENLAAGYIEWADVIESWISENTSFVFRSNSTSENLQTGHYTQVIMHKILISNFDYDLSSRFL